MPEGREPDLAQPRRSPMSDSAVQDARMPNDTNAGDANASAPVVLLAAVDATADLSAALAPLLRTSGGRVLIAADAESAFGILAVHPVRLVLAEQDTPSRDGLALLTRIRERHPETLRMLIVGDADLDLAVAACLDGTLSRFIRKPWHAGELRLVLRQALERRALVREIGALRERARLSAAPAADTPGMPSSEADSETLRRIVQSLEKAQQDQKQNFVTMLKVFSGMLELRAGMLGGSSSRVATLTQRMGIKFGLTADQVQELMVAGLLHAIGKIGLPDALIHKPLDRMSSAETQQYLSHAALGQRILTPLESLAGAGRIIAHQFERYDGRGAPDGLEGAAIPLGARILAIARDYEALRHGAMLEQALPEARVIAILDAQRGLRYDPQVVDRFIEVLGDRRDVEGVNTRVISSYELCAGQQLAEDLLSEEGTLLLTKDSVITPHYIRQILKFEEVEQAKLRIRVNL